MALRQLVHGLQRLSVSSTQRLPSTLSLTWPSLASGSAAQQLTNLTAIIPRCTLHTSPVCLRILDSHQRPPSREPSSKNKRWKPLPNPYDQEYTLRPLLYPKSGGRGPNGRIWNFRRAGGHKRRFRLIDWVRGGPASGTPLVEKVDKILYDPNRSGRIALVASGERKRYIIATQNMKPGDLIKSSQHLSATAVRAGEGDSYPVGSLPLGTLVNCLEVYPGAGGLYARSAGVTAQILRKIDDKVILRLPSKREICVANKCVATVGRVSNIDHNKRVIGKAGRNRWLGIRPHSGRWHRKDGRFGRKIKPVKPLKVFDKPLPPKPAVYRMTF